MRYFGRVLPHICIILSLMILVFVIIDHYNSAMMFIDNGITKGLLFILMPISILVSAMLIYFQRRGK